MSISMKSDDVSSRKGFMSRVSSVLLSAKTRRRLKPKTIVPPDPTSTNRLSHPMENIEFPATSISTDIQEPGYSTIHDLESHHGNDVNREESPAPPVPQKSMDIYAEVKKRGARLDHGARSKNVSEDKSHRTALLLERKRQVVGGRELINAQSSQEEDQLILTKHQHNVRGTKTEKHVRHCKKHHKSHAKHLTSQPGSSSQVAIDNSRLLQLKDEAAAAKSLSNKIIKLKQNHYEELLNLRQEMQHTDQENEALRAKIDDFLEKEYNWKENLEKVKLSQQEHIEAVENNVELNRRITKLEMDTQQEVQLLCRHINMVKHEKDQLIQQLKVLQHDNEMLHKKHEKLQEQQKQMVSVERHVKAMEESKKFLEELKMRYEQDTDKLQKIITKVEDQRNSLSIKMVIMESEQKRLHDENEECKKNEQEIKQKNKELSEELDHMKAHHAEATTAMKTLMEMAEKAVIERDAALKKSQLHDHQNKLIHNSVIEHSINVGRLEEHIVNLRKQMDEEVARAVMGKNDKELDYNYMKESYERQVYFLREKLQEKNSSLDTLVKEKRQLEMDLENLWETTLTTEKPLQNKYLNKLVPNKLNNH